MNPGKFVVGIAAALAVGLAIPARAQIIGFGGTNWTLNTNSASSSVPWITNGVLTLGTNAYDANSAFYDIPQYIGSFTASFVWQNNSNIDQAGFCFVLQNEGPNAVGNVGGNYLGYVGMSSATGVAFDINNNGDTPGLGYAPTQVPSGGPGGYIPTGGVNFHATNAILTTISYANEILQVTVTDMITGATFTTNFLENLTAAAGGTTAYVGFTGGGTGILNISINNFMFSPGSSTPPTSSFPVTLDTGAGDIDVTMLKGDESDGVIAFNPVNPAQMFLAANTNSQALQPGLYGAFSYNGGTNWLEISLANLPIGSDPAVAWDGYGNLFLAYADGSSSQGIDVAVSLDGGETFNLLTNLATGDSAVQPRIAVGSGTGLGSVWVLYKDFSLSYVPLVAQGAAVTGFNAFGGFGLEEIVPDTTNDCGFGDIAVGPLGQVMVAFQNLFDSSGAATCYVSVDMDGLGPNGFSLPVVAAQNAIGGETHIPAATNSLGINAAAGLAWDTDVTSQQYGRAYLVCVGQGTGGPTNTVIFLSYSKDGGMTWSAQARVDDDPGQNSKFMPRVAVDPTDGALALSWYDCREDVGLVFSTNYPTTNVITTNYVTNSSTITTNVSTNTITNTVITTNWTGTVDGLPNDAAMFYATVSLNGGVTFQPNVNVTSDTTNGYLAARAGNQNFGDYTGLTYYGGTFYPVWADNSGSMGLNPDRTNKDFDIVVAPVVLQGLADVSITSVLTNTTNLPQIGSVMYYFLTASNAGPSAVSAASVTDVFPPEVYVRAAFPANGTNEGTYVLHGNTLTWPVGALAPGGTATILVETTAVNIGNATNYAAISPGPGVTDLLTNNNAATLVSTIYGAELSLSMTAAPYVIGYGAPDVTFTVTVSNQGPVEATGVLISNVLSDNLVLTGVAYPAQYAYTTNASLNNTVFIIGDLTNGQVVTVSLTASAPLSLSYLGFGPATCDSLALGVISPANPGNTAGAEVEIVSPDMAIGMTASPAVMTVGDSVTYTLNVTNLGPVPAFEVMATDFLPPNLQLAGASVRKGTYIAIPDPSGNGQTDVIATLNEPLLAGQSGLVIITATAVALGQAVDVAVVSDAVPDSNPYNNTATFATSVLPPQLALGLTGAPGTVLVGQTATYAINVTNLGPFHATGVTLTNILSANLSVAGVSLPKGATYTTLQNVLTFNLGSMTNGQRATVVVTATALSPGQATVIAVAADSLVDANPVNTRTFVTTTINPQPPPFSNLTVVPGGTGVFITWHTPYNATAQVAYGLTAATNISFLNPTLTNYHVVLLTGLAPDTNYVFQARSITDGVLATTNGTFSTTDTIILGTTDASYAGLGWLTGGSANGIFGDNYRYVPGAGGAATAFTTYTPVIAATGLYDLSVWYPVNPGSFSSNTPMIATGATNVVTVSVNQTINGGGWQPLTAALFLTNGTTGNLTINNESGDTTTSVVANGARWAYELSQDAPTNGTVPAWWADFYFGGSVSGAADPYGVGYSNFAEYVLGADPTSLSGQLRFMVAPGPSANATVTFSPWQGGRVYQLQCVTNLGNPAWAALTNAPAQNPVNGSGFFTVGSTPGRVVFYRLAVSLAPNQ